jgi:hypothetical protein
LLAGFVFASTLAASPRAHAEPAAQEQSLSPRVFVLDAESLVAARAEARSGSLAPALAELRSAANRMLRTGPYSILDKQTTAPSGDPQDYLSLSDYWWPNPNTGDGLPYVQRDGRRNPEADDPSRFDDVTYSRMIRRVDSLSLAYYLTGEAAYADQASQQLRIWFLDPATRMNANMRFAEIIPGRPVDRGTGIIQSRELMRIVDDVGLLADSPAWTSSDQVALQAWFTDLVAWLHESDQGRMEARAPNNHGTWYAAQLADFALFSGQEALAADILSGIPARIAAQVEPDGSQPQELRRTKSFHYSAFNLLALTQLARIGAQVDVDLWSYQTADGRGIRGALDFLLPVAAGEAWPYQEIAPIDLARDLGPLLVPAARAYPDGPYGQILADLMASQRALTALDLRLGIWAL